MIKNNELWLDRATHIEKLEAENAALKEQVAQLTDGLRMAKWKTDEVALLEELTTLQSKSAALVDAIGGRWGWNVSSGSADWLTYEGETIGAKFAAEELNKALAAFKEKS